jgi:hypothetical protein
MKLLFIVLCLLSTGLFFSIPAIAQDEALPFSQPVPVAMPSEATSVASPASRFFSDGEWYFSWGYSGETWAPTDIHVSQPALGNNFTVHDVKGHDSSGWANFIQYNIRLGRFIDDDQSLAIELNFDHTKYSSTIGQTALVTGTKNNVPIPDNTRLALDEASFRYNLLNGANHLMVNLVKRLPLIGVTNESLSLAAIGKAGAGLMIPHSDNTISGNRNNVGEKKFNNLFGTHSGWWQFDGVTAGVEAGLRFVVAKPVYLELTDKIAYARLYDIPVYQGTAKQSLWMNEVIFSLGITYDGAKKAGHR